MTQRCDDRVTRAAYALGAGAYDDVWSPFILPPAEASYAVSISRPHRASSTSARELAR